MTVTPARAASRYFPKELLALWCTPITDLAMPVMDPNTGKEYEYRELRNIPKYKDIWEKSYSNELGHLCQGVGEGTKGPRNQRVEGTDTF